VIYATLNKKTFDFAWLSGLLESERVPLVSLEPADPDDLTALTGKVSYVAALDRLTREQQEAVVTHYAEQSGLQATEVEVLFGELGGWPVPSDAVIVTARVRG
jgi:hypothetical protein